MQISILKAPPAALLLLSASFHVAAAQGLLLACSVTVVDMENFDEFSTMFCSEAVDQLTSASGKAVTLVAANTLSEQSSAAWLLLDIIVKTPHAVSAQAIWGGGKVVAGEGAQLEAGIDDATLNKGTASLLVRQLLVATPFLGAQ